LKLSKKKKDFKIFQQKNSYRIVHLADYGLSKIYRNEREGHIKNLRKPNPIGTNSYLSKFVLDKNSPSRRDDLISVCYLLLEFAIGILPWSKIKLEEQYAITWMHLDEKQRKIKRRERAYDLKSIFTG